MYQLKFFPCALLKIIWPNNAETKSKHNKKIQTTVFHPARYSKLMTWFIQQSETHNQSKEKAEIKGGSKREASTKYAIINSILTRGGASLSSLSSSHSNATWARCFLCSSHRDGLKLSLSDMNITGKKKSRSSCKNRLHYTKQNILFFFLLDGIGVLSYSFFLKDKRLTVPLLED